MNISPFTTPKAAGLLITLIFSHELQAQNSTSDVVGYVAYAITAATAGTPVTVPVCFALTGRVMFASTIGEVTGNTFTSALPISVSIDPTKVFVQIRTGAFSGVAIDVVNIVGNTITVGDHPVGALAVGNTYTIRESLTLESGFIVRTDWINGATAATSNNVVFWNAKTQTSQTYFRDTENVWRNAETLTSSGDTEIPFPGAMMIVHRGTAPLDVFNVGHVPVPTTHWLPVETGLNLLGLPLDTGRLDTCGLFNESSIYSLAGGAIATEADTVTYYDAARRMPAVWFQTGPTGGWRDLESGAAAGHSLLPFYGAALIQRQGPPTWVRLRGVQVAASRRNDAAPVSPFRAAPTPVPLSFATPEQEKMSLSWQTSRSRHYVLQVQDGVGWKTKQIFRGTGRPQTFKSKFKGKGKGEVYRVVKL